MREPYLEPFACKGHPTLVVQDRSGQRHCFNCVVEAFQSPLYRLVAHMLGDWAQAEDVTQEALLSAYRAFSTFRGENLRAWLMRIAANAARDLLRVRKSRPSASLDAIVDETGDTFPSSDESPEEYAERRELGRLIQQGLASLPEEQRLALALVDVQGLSYEEAAQAMSTNLGTVKSRISRGRSAMRDFLRARGELLPAQFRQDS
ncbi:MAG: sigma-70 family RNA polymerase sigma factor [Chloroflexota bacterium]|nr:sigma-70 family RNA polymerase sigma factor [Chloroflexota bacterium]